MKGWQIFVHSVRLVLNNLDMAFRVSAVLYGVQAANQVALYLNPPPESDEGFIMPSPEFASQALILGVFAILASLWIAVAWHRFVLEGERPRGWLPVWHGRETLGYLGRSILIGLLIGVAIMVATIPVMVLSAMMPGLLGVMSIGLVGLGAYVFFRLGPILPACAVGKPLTLGEAWRATKDSDGAVLILALLVMAGNVLIQAPSFLGGQGGIIDLVYQVVTGWFATMIGVSILTTLYGHYVEGRAID